MVPRPVNLTFTHPLVKREGSLGIELMKKVTALGGEEEIKRGLRERGVSEDDTVAVPVMLWSQQDKRLKGTAWRLMGPKVETMLEATDLWEGLMVQDRKISMKLVFSLRKFRFPSAGELRTNSHWLSFEVSGVRIWVTRT